MVRAEKELLGYDSYEHSCNIAARKISAPRDIRKLHHHYLLKLEVPLDDVEKVKAAVRLDAVHAAFTGTADADAGEPVTFCKVDSDAKEEILRQMSRVELRFQPILFRYSAAEKAPLAIFARLASASIPPCHSIGPTLWMTQRRATPRAGPPAYAKGTCKRGVSKELEDYLRSYQTHQYEVVRCETSMGDRGKIGGSAFRFNGDLD
ncbi:hypothetical protein F5B20DRAFT_584273 [Whalleya microplaca]|nr:hypothetical protein F5B20DRAFT_584273 [Whalleya microplaca]